MAVSNNFYRDIKLFPGILICCWVFSVYRRIFNAVNEKEPEFAVSCIAIITVSVYGFCNFVAYWWTLSYQYKKEIEQGNDGDGQAEMHAIAQHNDSEDLSDD
eukprot:CAMPEP_0197048236 /NCGR_PEP_ID=MMETSP1384-20130603/23634_1 /TAXON_ID=29189 /ORGANISM="Ammonia sp." /LENGTH=101 /DNA_ID=CAMNT_0042480339 /DNA_START=95 /DNA_END=400 /DNA_ORIENTATION=-